VGKCVADWFLEDRLLNPKLAKTDTVLFGTRASQREKMPTGGGGGLNVTGAVVPFHDTVKLFGVTLDSGLTMGRQPGTKHGVLLYHMCVLPRHIRPLLTLDAAKMIIHSVVSSRLDYANTLLHQPQQAASGTEVNTLARVMCQALRSVSATELHRQLYCRVANSPTNNR